MLKRRSIQEHLERMKYVSGYQISETPKYKSLVGNSQFDALPEYLMKEAAPSGATPTQAPLPDEQPQAAAPGVTPEPAPAGGDAGQAPAPSPTASAAPTPETPPSTNVDISTAGGNPTDPTMTPPMDAAAPMVPSKEEAEKKVLELQLDALKKMSMKIDDLGSAVDGLNQRMAVYSAEVDKVREPSDMEKFEIRKDDSSPYYFNLNDLWDNNTFKSRMDQFSKGYVKTEDGYVADFDDLPKFAPHEVKASFDVM